MKRLATMLLLVASASIAAAQVAVEPFSLPSSRIAALGGPHAASVNGVDAIFENPAGFAADESELSISSLVVNPSGPVFDIAGIVVGGVKLEDSIAGLVDSKGRLYVNAQALGPFSFAYSGKGLGFGIYNRTGVLLNASSLLAVRYAVSEEILLAGGYAYRLRLGDLQTLDMGLMPKGFIRATVGKTASLTDIMALTANPGALLDSPLTMTSGLGFDAGLLWTYDDMVSLGLVMRDAYSPAMTTSYTSYTAFMDNPSSGTTVGGLVSADLAFGVAYMPRFDFLSFLGADVTVLLDYVDILDLFSAVPRNPILNVRLGAELRLLDILCLRAGIKDALPAAGFGIDLQAFTFSLAMHGQELGLEPGARPVFNLVAGFEFRY